MDSFSFGDNPKMANELLDLVLIGRKIATSWAAVHGSLGTKVGKQMIIRDGQKRPRVIVETTELTSRRFNDVDESFAHDEGEGDQTLAYWRKEHRDYFAREGTFLENMEVYCQRFKLIKVFSY